MSCSFLIEMTHQHKPLFIWAWIIAGVIRQPSSLSTWQIKNMSCENLMRDLQNISHKVHVWNDLEECTVLLKEIDWKPLFFFLLLLSTEWLSGAFSPGPSAYGFPLSSPARSKVIFDGKDNSFQPDRWDADRDAHHSSFHQTVKGGSWSITWRGWEN